MKEKIFYPIPNYEGYFATTSGLVKSFRKSKKGAIIKATLSKDGYLKFRLSLNRVCITTSIHRVVALTFIPNPENKKTVNHKDGNKLNNHVDNLEWATQRENMQHAFRNNLVPPLKLGKHGMAISVLNTMTGIFYDTITEAANSTGNYGKSFLCMALTGRRRNSTPFIYA